MNIICPSANASDAYIVDLNMYRRHHVFDGWKFHQVIDLAPTQPMLCRRRQVKCHNYFISHLPGIPHSVYTMGGAKC